MTKKEKKYQILLQIIELNSELIKCQWQHRPEAVINIRKDINDLINLYLQND